MLIGFVAAAIVVLLLAGFYGLGAVVLAWAWNFLVPLLWHAAPHLTWVHGLAMEILVSMLRGLFTVNQKVEKKA